MSREAVPLLALPLTRIVTHDLLRHFPAVQLDISLGIKGSVLAAADQVREHLTFPPREISLNTTPGAFTRYRLPARPDPLLRASTPLSLAWGGPATLTDWLVIQCPPERTDLLVEPGEHIPENPPTEFLHFVFYADQPTLPPELSEAIRQGTAVHMQRRPTLAEIVKDATNPLASSLPGISP